jgi:hypothetical protein
LLLNFGSRRHILRSVEQIFNKNTGNPVLTPTERASIGRADNPALTSTNRAPRQIPHMGSAYHPHYPKPYKFSPNLDGEHGERGSISEGVARDVLQAHKQGGDGGARCGSAMAALAPSSHMPESAYMLTSASTIMAAPAPMPPPTSTDEVP